MKAGKRIFIVISACVVLVLGLYIINCINNPRNAENIVTVINPEKETKTEINIETLSFEDKSIEVVDGKGSTIKVEGKAIGLFDFLKESLKDIDDYSVKVISEDEYNATIEASEIQSNDRAFLFYEDNELSLYVLGDKNSKRNVKNVEKIEILYK